MKERYLHEPSTCLVPLSEKSATTVELPRTHSAEDLSESEYHSSVLATSGSTDSCPIRDEVLLHLRKLVRAFNRVYCAQSQLSSCKQVEKAEPIDASLYQSTLNKIKSKLFVTVPTESSVGKSSRCCTPQHLCKFIEISQNLGFILTMFTVLPTPVTFKFIDVSPLSFF